MDILVALIKLFSYLRSHGYQIELSFLTEKDGSTSIVAALFITLIGATGAVGSAVLAAQVTSKNARRDANRQIAKAAELSEAELKDARARFDEEISHARLMARQASLNEAVASMIGCLDKLRMTNFSNASPAHLNEDWIHACRLVELNFDAVEVVQTSEFCRSAFGGIISQYSKYIQSTSAALEQIDARRDTNQQTKGTRCLLINGKAQFWSEKEGYDNEFAMLFFRATESIVASYSSLARAWPDQEAGVKLLKGLSDTLIEVSTSNQRTDQEIWQMYEVVSSDHTSDGVTIEDAN